MKHISVWALTAAGLGLAACAPLEPTRPAPTPGTTGPVAPAPVEPVVETLSGPAAAVKRALAEVCLPAVLAPAPVANYTKEAAFKPGAPAAGEPADTKVWTTGVAEVVAHPNGRCSVRTNAGAPDELRKVVADAIAARAEGFITVPAPATAGRERMAFCSDKTGRVFAVAVTLPGASAAPGPRFQATVLESVAQPGACARMAAPSPPAPPTPPQR